MHLQNASRFTILIWLPLAFSEKLDENLEIPKGLLYNRKGSEFLKSYGRKFGFDSVLDRGRTRDDNGASQISNSKISANSDVPNTRVKDLNAHGHAVKSALHVISSIRKGGNTSAAVMMTENKSRMKYFREWVRKRKRRKKRAHSKSHEPGMRGSAFVTDEEYENGDNDNDDEENDEINLDETADEDIDVKNVTELGRYLGLPCEESCSSKLLHVFCDPNNRICECEKKYPVQIGIGRGCAKPKQLGDQCFYTQTCSFTDPNAICTQINHNAICQCKPGFHSVALRRGAKRSFCSEDQVVVSTDLPTLLGVATGIAVLTGMICFVLKLFNNNRFPDRGRYNNANIAPPLLLSSDNQWINGIPLTVHGRPSSRTSSQRSTTNLAHYSRSKGVLVPASRAGAARAAAILLIPCHLQATKGSDSEVASRSRNDESDTQENDKEQFSRPGSRRPSVSSIKSTTSSQKSMSYSARRFDQENQQKEARAAMRAAREEAARLAAPPTPSPLSTDELIPSLEKVQEDDPPGLESNARRSSLEKSDNISPGVPQLQICPPRVHSAGWPHSQSLHANTSPVRVSQERLTHSCFSYSDVENWKRSRDCLTRSILSFPSPDIGSHRRVSAPSVTPGGVRVVRHSAATTSSVRPSARHRTLDEESWKMLKEEYIREAVPMQDWVKEADDDDGDEIT